MFSGAMVALVTPFRKGKVDEKALGTLVEEQIRKGTQALIPCGTTGESATLSHEEHDRVIEITIACAARRVPVLAGTGSNSTAEAVRLTRHAKQAGADGALMITPYYNRPTQEGLFRHYEAVAREVEIPIVLYNVPTRTGVNLLPETVERLATIPTIAGIKEASGSLAQACEIHRRCGVSFDLISGEDSLTLPMIAIGGCGVISVVSNVAPVDMAGMVRAALAGDFARARELHHKMWPLMNALFIETNPIPVKAALALMGKMDGEVRLPLSPMSEGNLKKLEIVLKDYGLL